MDITWYGHSCFRLNERNFGSVVCDPYDHEAIGYDPLKLKADIVCCSNEKPGHHYLNGIVKSEPFIIDRPGEYEINEIYIHSIASSKKDEPMNLINVIEINGIFVAHMGNIKRTPTQQEVEELGTVHVLMIPVGGGAGLNASLALETISKIQPRFVLPMHYAVPRTIPELDPLDKFLKEMGIPMPEELPTSFKVPTLSNMSDDDDTKVIILKHPSAGEIESVESAAPEEAGDAA